MRTTENNVARVKERKALCSTPASQPFQSTEN